MLAPAYGRNLPPDIGPLFGDVRKQCPAAFASFAAVAASYEKRDYTFEEFGSALHSLADAVHKRDALLAPLGRGNAEVPIDIGASGDPLILYVNPTCDECARAAQLVLEAAKRSAIEFPPVILRLLPSHEVDSARAATYLELLRQRDSTLFPAAVLEVLQAVPDGKASLEVALRPYLTSLPPSGSEEWQAATTRLAAGMNQLSSLDISPPFAVYRGRRVARYRTGKVPFEPFHDADSLILTISAIRVADHAVGVCGRESKRSMR